MSSRRSNLFLVLLIVLALVGVGLLAAPGSPFHRGVKKGLDLQGGLEVVLKAQPPPGHKLQKSDLDRSVTIMRERVDKIGVASPEIREQSPDEIVIQLAGVHDPAQAAAIIGKTAQLELYDLTPALESPSIDARGLNVNPSQSLYALLNAVQSRAKTGTPTGYVLFRPVKITTTKTTGTGKNKKTKKIKTVAYVIAPHGGPTATLHRDPTTGNPGLLDSHGGKAPKGWKVLKVPAKTVVVTCSAATTSTCPGDPNGLPPGNKIDYYLFKHGSYPNDRYATDGKYPNMTGAELNLGGVRQDFDTSTGEPIVLLSFKGKGAKTFLQVTNNEATRGTINGLNSQTCGATCAFAIVLDNEIRSWPAIDPSTNPHGIDPRGTGAEINNIGSLSEAKTLALVLQTGALPVRFNTIEQTEVSATLGKDSLRQAYEAAIGGMIVVALFLLFLYRFLGLVAVIGLAIYAAFMYAAILLFGVTLTLPGFAGLILTIGVAADANVVIFERIKEESRAGKSVRASIAAGYAKGFRTIVDANVVTAITALILFAVASASVKGFALMLLIGTVVSLITAVAATRAMLGLLAGFRWFENPRFMGAHHSQRGAFLQIDFMKRIALWFGISGAVLVISVASLAVRGLNLGIDFRGGTQVTFKTTAYESTDQVRTAGPAVVGHAADAVIQGVGKSVNGGYKSFQVRLKHLTSVEQSKMDASLQAKANATDFSIKSVSSSFGRQIARSAIIAILFSLVVISLYITIRFRGIAFAVPVIAAMLHDVLITVGVYSVTGREVTEATVAAVLTVLGYSIYDTIIIFDRIRENIPLMRRASFATIVNVSLWETIRRSLATTFITLLPVAALFLFGGATLKDFAFALLIGVTSGAYSSIFIAAPIVKLWKSREPEYARRATREMPEGAAASPMLQRAEAAAAAAPTPDTPVDVAERVLGEADGAPDDEAAKRERRRQRRKSRPHGRAR